VQALVRGKWRNISSGQRLAAGRYELRIQHPDGGKARAHAVVSPRESTEFSYDFPEGKVKVLITRPFGMGGKVLERGKRIGTIPGPALRLSAGDHLLTISSEDGTRSKQKKVTIKRGKEANLTVTFD